MKYLLVILFCSSFFSSFSQTNNFAPIGAKWWYNLYNLNPEIISYSNIESKKDTTIDGKQCKQLLHSKFFAQGDTSIDTIFMYGDSNIVYYYFSDSSRFCLLYDFNAVAGDTFVLDCFLSGVTGGPLVVKVDSTDSLLINSNYLKVLFTSDNDGLASDFSGIMVQNIGNLNYLFPTPDNSNEIGLRCYEDSVIGIYKPNTNIECDFITNDVLNYEYLPNIILYPNPTEDVIYIKNNANVDFNKLDIYNIAGEKVLSFQMQNNHNIYSFKLKEYMLCGNYFLVLHTINNELYFKMIYLK